MGMSEYSEHILFGKGLIYTVVRSDNVHIYSLVRV